METNNINFEIDKSSKIHFIGIGGISMSGIAIMLKKSGYSITGSDITENDMVQEIKKENIPVLIGHDLEYVKDADIVVYTAAVPANDPELNYAKENNKLIYERAEFLGILIKGFEKPICVAGMHGKTTTTSMISNALEFCNTSPTVLVGSRLRELGYKNYKIGTKEYLALESCEYVDSFLHFPGHTSIILNIEEEHLDYFKNLKNIKTSFSKFMLLTKEYGNVILNSDDSNISEILASRKLDLDKKRIKVYTFSTISTDATLHADAVKLNSDGCYEFDAYFRHKKVAHVQLGTPGKHNVYNALATICVALIYDLDIVKVVESLKEFTGASRRFEFKKTILNNVSIYDDYAHHPTEIEATLQTAKEKSKARVIAVFQPHTYSRTLTLLDGFSQAFYNADDVIITDIYAAREIDNGKISSDMLVERLQKHGINAKYISKFEDIASYLKNNAKTNDIILTIGAGTITKLSDML